MAKEKAPNGKDKVDCKLVGEDCNAFAIMGRVTGAMRRAGWTDAERKQYTDAATKGNYDHLIQVTMEYTNDIGSDDEEEEDSEEEE